MKRKVRKRLEAFVRDRTAELSDPGVAASHQALLKLTELLRKEAAKESTWDWIEAAALGGFDGDGGERWADDLIGENVFGDDPESQATTVITAIHQALALAHADHPDYDAAWSPRRRG